MTICKKCGAENTLNDSGYCKFCLTPLDAENHVSTPEQHNSSAPKQNEPDDSSGSPHPHRTFGGNIMVKTAKPKTEYPETANLDRGGPDKQDLQSGQSSIGNDDESLFEIKEVNFNEASVPGLVKADDQPAGTFRSEDILKDEEDQQAHEETDSIENELDLYHDEDNYMLTMEETENGPAVTLEDQSDISTSFEIPPQMSPEELEEESKIAEIRHDELMAEKIKDDIMTQKIIINPQVQQNKTTGEKNIESHEIIPPPKPSSSDEEFFTRKHTEPSPEGTDSIPAIQRTKIDEEVIAKATEGPSPIQAHGIAYITDNTVKFFGGYKPSPGDNLIVGNTSFVLKEKPAPKIKPLYYYIGGGVLALVILIIAIAALMPTDSGSIVGILIDPSTNEVVPKATIVLKEANKTTQTSYAGFFTFDDVPPGLYTIELQDEGVGISTERLTVLENRASAIRMTIPVDEPSAISTRKKPSAEPKKKAEKEAGPGFMKLTLSPKDSKVYYDGDYIGKGTQTFKVVSGKHKLTVKQDGYKSKTLTVRISENAIKSYKVSLSKLKKSEKPDVKTDEEIAQDLEDDGKYSEALKYYQKVLSRDKNDVEGLLGKARCLQAKGNNDEALATFLSAVKITSDRNDNDAQLEALNGVLSINPNYLTARYKRGLILFDQKEYYRAAQDFNKVIEIDRRHLNAFYKLGESYYRAGNYPAAIEAYEGVQELNFADAKPFAYIAKSYMKLDDKKNTKKYYDMFEKKADMATKSQINSDPEWSKVKAVAQ